jgi:hypothetical protein
VANRRYEEAHRGRWKKNPVDARPIEKRVCARPGCGREFVPAKGGRLQKYCCRRCGDKQRRKTERYKEQERKRQRRRSKSRYRGNRKKYILEYGKIYREKHPEYFRTYQRRFYEKHPDYQRSYRCKRNAEKLALELARIQTVVQEKLDE